MGTWKADQSKGTRRYVWGETRGKEDATLRDIAARAKKQPDLGDLRPEKIGSEIHFWREVTEKPSGKTYWLSCLRFVDDGWSYWTVFFRPDDARWRATPLKDLPLSKAISGAAEIYRERLHEMHE